MGATNCPETPRQKMISMMYLVLTALLALNVSREIVEAFVLVDGGLNETIENFDEKNKTVYDNFSKQETQNEEKVKPWRVKADEIKVKSKDLHAYIQGLKKQIIITAEGEETPAVKGNEIYSDSITKADDLNIGGQIMIGAEHNGKAYELRQLINDYRDEVLDITGHPGALEESIKKVLNTDDPGKEDKETERKTWETVRFDHLPLIAVVTMLTKIQTDISNVESDAINYLYSRIGALDIKVNEIEAVVRAKSNYIFKGGDYQAEVFLAAFDTTQKPKIYHGRVDSTVDDNGEVKYFMAGQQGRDWDTLHVENGMGIYTDKATSVSPNVKWGGLIEIKGPGGDTLRYPYKANYQVGDIGLVVSPTLMNVFYIGVDNPVDISVPGVPKENIVATMSNGKIKPDSKTGAWNVRPGKPDGKGKKTKISVTAKIDGRDVSMGAVEFRVKNVPDPVAKINMQKGGTIQKNVLLAQTGILAEIENFDFKMPFRVTSFDVIAVIKGFSEKRSSNNHRFSGEQVDLIKNLKRGDRVTFDNIKAKGDDGTRRDLPPIIFKLR